MEDDRGESKGGHLSENQSGPLAEKMGSENLARETNYKVGDHGEEIMVAIVGSDVFVDGVRGKQEGDLKPAETAGMDVHVLEERREPEAQDIPEVIDVSGKGHENKTEESEPWLPESSVEKELVDTGKSKIAEKKMFPETRVEKIHVITGEDEKGTNEPGLLGSNIEENEAVTGAMDIASELVEDKNIETDSRSLSLRVEKKYVGAEAMNVFSKGDENRKGKSASELSKSFYENKLEANESGLPGSRDEENEVVNGATEVLNELGEDKNGEIDLRPPLSRDEKNYAESMDVCGEGDKNGRVKTEFELPKFFDDGKFEANESGLPVLTGGENEVVTEAMDVSSEMGENNNGETDSKSPLSIAKNNNVVTESTDVCGEGDENRMGKSECGLPKSDYEDKIEADESGLHESKGEENEVVTGAMDVSSELGKDKNGETDSVSPLSMDEKNSMVTEAMNLCGEEDENKIGKSECGLLKSDDEDKIEANESGLHESKGEENEVLTGAVDVLSELGKDKNGETDSRSPLSRDPKNYVVTEAMELFGEGDENRKGKKTECGLPKSDDEDKKEVNELGLPGPKGEENEVVTRAMDVLSELGKDKKGETDLRSPLSSDEKNNVVTEAMDVCGEEDENRMGKSECGLPKSDDEDKIEAKESGLPGSENEVLTGNMDVSSEVGQDNNGEPDLKSPLSKDHKNIAVTETMDVYGEGDDGNRKGKSESGLPDSDDEDSLVVKEISNEGDDNTKSEVVNKEATLSTQSVIGEARMMLKDEAVDENCSSRKEDLSPLSVGVSNKNELDTNSISSHGASESAEEGQIVLSAAILSSDDKSLENIQVDVIDSVVENSLAPDFPVTANVDKKHGLAAETKDLVVKSNGSAASNAQNVNKDCIDESHGTNFEPNHENEKEHTVCEELEVVLAFSNGTLDEIVTGMANKDERHKAEIQADTEENLPNQPEVVARGELSENTEVIVSEAEMKLTLASEENVEIRNTVEQSGLPQSGEHEEVSIVMDTDSDLKEELLRSKPKKSKLLNEEKSRPTASPPETKQLGYYFSPPESEARKFTVSDLVWGKVRNHPWWPGQIFDSGSASEDAMKHHKKDSYLVAYFGDQTFAWNGSSLLKPFGPHFFQIERQSDSRGFQHAVACALEEVSRRVELGLACSCIPNDKYASIEAQIVENAGIREEFSKRHGVDRSSRTSLFEPDKLVEYVGDLAPNASCRADRLDLAIARAQLSAFYRFKGYRPLAVFVPPEDLPETDAEVLITDEEVNVASHKSKHAPKDSLDFKKERSLTGSMGDSESEYAPKNSLDSKKERSLVELMGGGEYADNKNGPCWKKQKVLDPSIDEYDKRVSVYAAKVSNLTSQTPGPNKPSFRIGECIRRVASQLTGLPSERDETVIDERNERRGTAVLSVESFTVDEMLTQLERVAREPKRRHDFISVVHGFFVGFRSSVALNRRARKNQAAGPGGAGEEFEFDDVSDSYWIDRIVQSHSDERHQQHSNNHVNGLGRFPMVEPFGVEKQAKTSRRPYSRKRFSNIATAASELEERVKRAKQESSPAELILSFSERNNIPSEINLNKMFRRFGPLMESETEVDRESGWAKVIFKRGGDAEVARDSSERFNIFGQGLVNYRVGYEPLISVRVLPLLVPPLLEDATFMR